MEDLTAKMATKRSLGENSFNVVSNRDKSSKADLENFPFKRPHGLDPRPRLDLLPFSGRVLAKDKILPHTRSKHDLAEFLIRVTTEEGFDAPLLMDLVQSEVKTHLISQKHFSRLLGVQPSSFSTYTRSPKAWSEAGHILRQFHYNVFLWLNLDLKDRLGIFYPEVAILEDTRYTMTCF